MWNFFSEESVRKLSVGWGSVIIVGLFLTRWFLVLPSIGIAGLFVTSVGYAVRERCIKQSAQSHLLLSFTAIYGLHLLSGLWHGGRLAGGLGQDLVLQLPFLLLPISFWLLPAWRTKDTDFLWLVLVACCCLSATVSAIYYAQHAHDIDIRYNESQVMPTEPDHPRFSLLISMAVIWAVFFLLRGEQARRMRFAVAFAALALFLFQQLLAARGGLLSMYVAGLVALGWLAYGLKRWKIALLSSLLAFGIGAACLVWLPTLRIRVQNTFYDVAQASSTANANNFSITARLYSYDIARTIISQHPWLGVGKVQLPAEMATQYSYRYPEILSDRYVLPHNQFVYVLACYGIVGLLFFAGGYYYALVVAVRQRNMLAVCIYLITTISFLGEYTLETNIGVIVGLFFPLLAIAPKSELPVVT